MNFNNFTILIYFMVSILIQYNFKIFNHNYLLISLVIIQVNILFLLKNKILYISKKIIYIALGMLVSFFFNIGLKSFYYYFFNIMLLINLYIITKYNWNFIKKLIYYLSNIASIVNFFLLLLSKNERLTSKYILGYELYKFQIPYIGVSSLTITSIYSLCSIFYLKNKFFKVLFLLMNLFIIIYTGKFTAIFSIVVSLLIFVLLKSFSLQNRNIIMTILLNICFFSSGIIYVFLNTISKFINTENIFSGRIKLWFDYINSLLGNCKFFLFGGGFIGNREEISYLAHAHNQYLEIYFTLGIFSLLLFYLFFNNLKNKIVKYAKGNEDLVFLFIALIIIMCGDDYFILTIYPIHLTTFMLIYNIKFKINANNIGIRRNNVF